MAIMEKKMVYLTVPEFKELMLGKEVRQSGGSVQLGQGASFADFRRALEKAETELGADQTTIRYDTFVCGRCRRNPVAVHGTQKRGRFGIEIPKNRCRECARI